MFSKSIMSQRGFTMIELLTVLVIIGVLVTISMVAYNTALNKARLARVKTNVGEIVLALDSFAVNSRGKYPALTVYHNSSSGNIITAPAAPQDPIPGQPTVMTRRGNAIIGGGPPLADTGNPLQDDFYRDMDGTYESFFRDRLEEFPFSDGVPMRPVDQLVLNGQLDAYPVNPIMGLGIPMVNIAYMLYDYDTQTNSFRWVDFTVSGSGEPTPRRGLCAARPASQGVYEPIAIIWDESTYPQGDFAYIPLEFHNAQGTYCNGYWIICYGDLSTLQNSEYNKFALDALGVPFDDRYANWPNFPQPFGDGNPNSPPAEDSVEFQVKRLVQGALDIRATIFEDQLNILEEAF